MKDQLRYQVRLWSLRRQNKTEKMHGSPHCGVVRDQWPEIKLISSSKYLGYQGAPKISPHSPQRPVKKNHLFSFKFLSSFMNSFQVAGGSMTDCNKIRLSCNSETTSCYIRTIPNTGLVWTGAVSYAAVSVISGTCWGSQLSIYSTMSRT